jgi:hypothetical protein
VAEHDWRMPHDIRFPADDVRACPPNCPFRLEHEDDTGLPPEQQARPTAAAVSHADAAWAELEALRAEAQRLGLEDYRTDPLGVLRERVERARAES